MNTEGNSVNNLQKTSVAHHAHLMIHGHPALNAKPGNVCHVCGDEVFPNSKGRFPKLCTDPDCKREIGKRSARERWGSKA
jgi:hypothetical protein